MTSLLCRLCACEIDHGTVCAPCVGALAADLRACWPTGNLHGLDEDLDIAIAKASRFGSSGGGGRPSEPPLLIDENASETRRHLHGLLSTWCRLILDDHGGQPPADTISGMARYLHSQTTTIRVAEWGDACVQEIQDAIWEARKVIDRPAERIYAGQCPKCGSGIYGVAGRDRAWCRTEGCEGEIEDPEGRRNAAVRAAVEAAPEQTVTAAEAAMASRALGRSVTDRAVRKMAAEGRIVPVQAKRPARYRLGDIMDVLTPKQKAS